MNEKKKIAVFHWGQISIHTFYLVEQLRLEDLQVDLFLYSPDYANKNVFLKNLIALLDRTLNVIEFKPSRLETIVVRLNRIAKRFNLELPLLCINPFLPLRTRRKFKPEFYASTITVSQSSLYWLHRTNRSSIHTNIHYSLEIEKLTDPGVHPALCLYALIKKETFLLAKVKALLIQDKARFESLVGEAMSKKIKPIYLPVSVPGAPILNRSTYLYEKLNIPLSKKIILYYGAIYEERKIEEVVAECENFRSDEFMLVLHGGGEFSSLIKNPAKARASNELLDYPEVEKIISSATIGIAFYDNSWPNTRLTAFSSEKISRYLQAGVPFIATRNDNYETLQNEFNCCVLINDFNEMEAAVNTIIDNYSTYRENCYKAFEKYFRIENSIKPLVQFIRSS